MQKNIVASISVNQLPDFFIIGAQKCGTTSLYHWLKVHPKIFMPENKEPHFYARLDLISTPCFAKTLSNAILSPPQYHLLYSKTKDGQIRGEASPSYIWDTGAAYRIHNAVPHAKIIVLLRDPVQRAYSEYIMLVAAGLESLDFISAIEKANTTPAPIWGAGPMYIELGKYGTQLKRYCELFNKSQIKIFTNKELWLYPKKSISSIAYFLGIDPGYWQEFDFSANIHHRGGLPRNTFMKMLISARWARAVGRAFVPKRMRPMVTERVMIKHGKKDEIPLRVKQIVWEKCEKEILLAEALVGRNMPELWLSHPQNHNKI